MRGGAASGLVVVQADVEAVAKRGGVASASGG